MTKQQQKAIKEQIDYMVSLVPNGESCGFNPQLILYMALFSNHDEENKTWTTDDKTKTIRVLPN